MDVAPQQRVLVTGASGFIGGRLVRRLVERHCQVVCLVRVRSRTDQLRSAGAQLVTGDVTNRGSVEQALAQSQAGTVFHLAGLVSARPPMSDDFMLANAGGVQTVAAACACCAAPPVLIVVSSLAAAGPSDAEQPRVENDCPAPVSRYGRSKLAGEQAAARYAGAVPITLVRPPIVFGPGDRAVLEMFRSVARWGLHVVPGSGGHRLSLIHVDDLVEGLLLVAEKGERLREQGVQGEGIYFIGAEENLTHTQLGQVIAKALGQKPPAVIRMPGPLLRLVGIGADILARVRHHPSGNFRGWISSDKITEALAGSWTCSSVKARTQLGWVPAASLADRMNETAQWYRQAEWL